MFSIAWEFLTGVYRATDFTDRSLPEWPIHPDRVFQALVASWAERGAAEDEKLALIWLESIGNPAIVAPEITTPDEPVRVFVPTNDIEASTVARKRGSFPDSLIALLPDKRKRKPRYFPHVWVGEQTCALVWPNVSIQEHQDALQRLCAEVTRIGHSSSFVRCWIENDPREFDWVPTVHRSAQGIHLRVPTPGRLERLIHAYAEAQKHKRYEGTPKAVEIRYRKHSNLREHNASSFSPRMIVLSKVSRSPIDITSTLALTDALRKTLIPAAQRVSDRTGQLISGHVEDGSPLNAPHVAYAPLPYVGSKYSDGHIIGLAMILPQMTSPQEEDDILRSIAASMSDNGVIRLLLGRNGTSSFALADGLVLQKTLQPESWVGPASTWASVTPIVMDRMQNARRADPNSWAEIQLRRMFKNIGLPEPHSIQTGPISPVTGTAAIRSWPPMRRKDGTTRRMLHAVCHFRQPVFGPILLGSGRYRGYGLMKPVDY
jgi:CRISPR-associated protein Csb2